MLIATGLVFSVVMFPCGFMALVFTAFGHKMVWPTKRGFERARRVCRLGTVELSFEQIHALQILERAPGRWREQ
ncbi:MAG: hypothetical protein JNK82_27165 [Myxococcaceae bacterium]|nr:hypothetical protein [Myxococcaceae bacterium]